MGNTDKTQTFMVRCKPGGGHQTQTGPPGLGLPEAISRHSDCTLSSASQIITAVLSTTSPTSGRCSSLAVYFCLLCPVDHSGAFLHASWLSTLVLSFQGGSLLYPLLHSHSPAWPPLFLVIFTPGVPGGLLRWTARFVPRNTHCWAQLNSELSTSWCCLAGLFLSGVCLSLGCSVYLRLKLPDFLDTFLLNRCLGVKQAKS